MPPTNREDQEQEVYYDTLKDVFRSVKSGRPRQGWQHWRDFIHRIDIQLGYGHPLPDSTLKIDVRAGVLLVAWLISMAAWAAVVLTTDAVMEDFKSKGRFQEFYAIPRALPFTRTIFLSFEHILDEVGILV